MSNYKQSTNKKSKPFERMAYYSDRRTSKCLLYFLMSKIKFNFLTTNVPPSFLIRAKLIISTLKLTNEIFANQWNLGLIIAPL